MPTEIETERLVGRLPRVADGDAMLAIYGDAAEAAEAAVTACFAAVGVESVTARARPDNPASQAVARSLGFVYERDVEHLGQAHHLYRRRASG